MGQHVWRPRQWHILLTNLFDLPVITPSAIIWWNFQGNPDHYHLTMILVTACARMARSLKISTGSRPVNRIAQQARNFVTVDGMSAVIQISFTD